MDAVPIATGGDLERAVDRLARRLFEYRKECENLPVASYLFGETDQEFDSLIEVWKSVYRHVARRLLEAT